MTLDLDQVWRDYVEPLGLYEARPDFRFDVVFYGNKFPELLEKGVDLKEHYYTHGRKENRHGNMYSEFKAVRPRADNLIDAVLLDSDLARAARAGQEEAYELLYELMALPHGIDAKVSHFSREHYLTEYPDVGEAGVFPLRHFLEFGRREKRNSLLNIRRNFHEGDKAYDPAKPTMMFMVHQLSMTGAPMVGLELMRQASEKYNVIALSLQDGPLMEPYRRECMALFISPNLHQQVDFVLKHHLINVEFALLNSVDCSLFIPALVARGIPFCFYVHEFPEYSVPLHKTIWTTFYADLKVFSSEYVRDAWRNIHEDLGFDTDDCTTVIPQAPLVLDKVSRKQHKAARERLSKILGVDCSTRKIVYGAGSVHWRKGTDLFMTTAQLVHKRDPEALFIWMGDGLIHEDFNCGVWMEKQMREARANEPGSYFHFLPAGDHYWDVCAGADVMYLSSRMDPLPGVVLDGAEFDCDVLLFRDASGFDDAVYDKQERIHKVPFGDVEAAADTIAALPSKASRIGRMSATKKITKKLRLDPDLFDKIAGFIEEKLGARRRFVLGEGDYDLPVLFTEKPHDAQARIRERQKAWSLGRQTVWQSEDEARRVVAKSDHPVHQSSKIVRYSEHDPEDLPPFSIHIHAYYTDDLAYDIQSYEVYRRANRIVITTDATRKANTINEILKETNFEAEIVQVPNTGRDILPFMNLFWELEKWGGDEIWGHMHQKKSISSTPGGDVWRNFMLSILMGGKTKVSNALLQLKDPDIGLVAPFDPFMCGWFMSKKNLPIFQPRIETPLPTHPLLFPVGNMFWVRRGVVEHMNSYFGRDYPWPNEPIANDGSVFHLIERLWPTATYEMQKKSVFISKPDQPRR
ncbi:rhamnan synthesis F family protein [Pseudaestuariivita atlantica]|uniref:Glycosyl transferase n=1 Tax=Pseudaestuariivita atlantica TaxID=1317121 RepID=A0A0L1JKF2_9RHOB|nr:rhamnan synthesis F family protein [Pseudaestuariivita atlantica]KNG92226.1 hypothetical protein ATO11_18360 [Pseudaestuariivita atlantica]